MTWQWKNTRFSKWSPMGAGKGRQPMGICLFVEFSPPLKQSLLIGITLVALIFSFESTCVTLSSKELNCCSSHKTAPAFTPAGVIFLYYKVEANKQKTDKCCSILTLWVTDNKKENVENRKRETWGNTFQGSNIKKDTYKMGFWGNLYFHTFAHIHKTAQPFPTLQT